jgi:predicted site-specific integrase-resolvase
MTSRTHWVSSRVAADSLGMSERTLYRWRTGGLLKPGLHWRRKFPAPGSAVVYDLAAVESAMRESTARNPAGLELA